MKPLTISRKRIEAAVSRGQVKSSVWRKRFPSEAGWQWSCVELASLPEVWARMGRKQTEEGGVNMTRIYGKPAPVHDLAYRLPGWVMLGWSSGPRAGWEWGHMAGNVWNGIRRNLYCSLVELLYGLVVGDEDRQAQCESDLVIQWAVRVK